MIRETYKGRRLAVKASRKRLETHSYVNGQRFGTLFGTSVEIQRRELESLRRWVDAADERRLTDPDAYPAYWYEGAEEVAEGWHRCDSADFSRAVCPEPCGWMHSYCTTCRARQEPCAHSLA